MKVKDDKVKDIKCMFGKESGHFIMIVRKEKFGLKKKVHILFHVLN